jgi:prevent-host-death family protein
MNGIWQLQDAKNKLSEVIERALRQGPQLITRRG